MQNLFNGIGAGFGMQADIAKLQELNLTEQVDRLKDNINKIVEEVKPIVQKIEGIEKILNYNQQFNLDIDLKELNMLLAEDVRKMMRYFLQKGRLPAAFQEVLEYMKKFESYKLNDNLSKTLSWSITAISLINNGMKYKNSFSNKKPGQKAPQKNIATGNDGPKVKRINADGHIKPSKWTKFKGGMKTTGKYIGKGLKYGAKNFQKGASFLLAGLDIVKSILDLKQSVDNIQKLQNQKGQLQKQTKNIQEKITSTVNYTIDMLDEAKDRFKRFCALLESFVLLIEQIKNLKNHVLDILKEQDNMDEPMKEFMRKFRKPQKIEQYRKGIQLLDAIQFWNKEKYADIMIDFIRKIEEKKWSKQNLKGKSISELIPLISELASFYEDFHKNLDLRQYYIKIKKCFQNSKWLIEQCTLQRDNQLNQFIKNTGSIIQSTLCQQEQQDRDFKFCLKSVKSAFVNQYKRFNPNIPLKQPLSTLQQKIIAYAIARNIKQYKTSCQTVTECYGFKFDDLSGDKYQEVNVNAKIEDIDMSFFMTKQWVQHHIKQSVQNIYNYLESKGMECTKENPIQKHYKLTSFHPTTDPEDETQIILYLVQSFVVQVWKKGQGKNQGNHQKYYAMYQHLTQQGPLVRESLYKK